jgi:hypothetical protein
LFVFFFVSTFSKYQYTPKRNIKTLKGPQKLNVHDLGLVSEDILYTTVVKNNEGFSKKTNLKHFKNEVLGYITPWNKKGFYSKIHFKFRFCQTSNLNFCVGYEFAEIFASKFNFLSPVWFNVKWFEN